MAANKPWQPGHDVPAYVRLYNKGSQADELISASTPNAASAGPPSRWTALRIPRRTAAVQAGRRPPTCTAPA
ncbi:hypothetical protein ABTX99_22480 [Streptomyces flaveolus]|uniref:hypothetical protein n=1 Tax=Streptomyces flaveolus TaxID=67297 RepID=UPI003320E2A9